jgi:hypothetical protein
VPETLKNYCATKQLKILEFRRQCRWRNRKFTYFVFGCSRMNSHHDCA